jgi:hypothetical protein
MKNKGQISLILSTCDGYTLFRGVTKVGSVSNVLFPIHSVCAMKMNRDVEEKGVRKSPRSMCFVERKIALYCL